MNTSRTNRSVEPSSSLREETFGNFAEVSEVVAR
jgi:hypothetical protein